MTKTIILDIPQGIKDFIALENGVMKNIKFNKLNNKIFNYSDVIEDNGNIYYAFDSMSVSKIGKGYFLRKNIKRGFSYKDGKLKFWFGNGMRDMYGIEGFFKHMNWNFLDEKMYSFITKSTLEKLLKKKITNPRSLLKEYCKSVRIKCSTELLYKAVIKGLNKIEFYRLAIIAEDVNHFLEYYLKNGTSDQNLMDMVHQYQTLNKKINFQWSAKRIHSEHNLATKELMKYEMELLEDISIDYPEFPDVFTDGKNSATFKAINTQKDLFQEGYLMNHCVYTNYWDRVKDRKYIAFQVQMGDERCTLGVHFYKFADDSIHWEYNQVMCKNNIYSSEDMKNICKKYIKENQNMFFQVRDKDESFEKLLQNVNDAEQEEFIY